MSPSGGSAPGSGTSSGTGADDRDDRTLLGDFCAGDQDAFEVLFRRHRDRLWAIALRTTGNREDAADALQDAMIAAFRRAGDFRGDARVTTWLHRIVVNASLDRLRRNKVRAAEPLPDDLEEYAARGAVLAAGADATSGPVGGRASGRGSDRGPRSQDWDADPAEHAVATERRHALLAALDALPAEQKAALVLVDMEGYPVEEVARILDCAPGTVKSRCSRGRARLLALLGEGTGHRPAASHSAAADGPEQPPDGPDDDPTTRGGAGR
ncbi:MAG TPA: RNA polymerase sigma factor SigM [Marmoricola sp.]|nr:RNA polymerase sigma factor SigM [Marmoricola sp.]